MIEVWLEGFVVGVGMTLLLLASFVRVRKPWR